MSQLLRKAQQRDMLIPNMPRQNSQQESRGVAYEGATVLDAKVCSLDPLIGAPELKIMCARSFTGGILHGSCRYFGFRLAVSIDHDGAQHLLLYIGPKE